MKRKFSLKSIFILTTVFGIWFWFLLHFGITFDKQVRFDPSLSMYWDEQKIIFICYIRSQKAFDFEIMDSGQWYRWPRSIN